MLDRQRFATLLLHAGLVVVTVTPVFAQAGFSRRKLEELDALPSGLTIQHMPNPVAAGLGGRSGRRYTWLYRTTVSATADTITVTEFGAFFWKDGHWQFSTFTGKPFSARDFAEWYGCPGARVVPGVVCADSLNWSGSDSLMADRVRWYYIGVTARGQRVKGEAVVEHLAAVDTTKAR